MAIAVEVNFRGHDATLDRYMQAIQQMGAGPQARHPDPACLFHWISETPDGLHVTDVWTTQEAFEQFAQQQIGPISEQVGLPQPQIGPIVQVANYMTAG